MALASAFDLHVPVFAGQGTSASNTPQVREQALRDASTPPGAVLLSACHESFITELSTMSLSDFEEVDIDLADFPKPSSLLTLPDACYHHNPVLSGSTLFLLQALRYLSFIHHIAETTGSCTPFSDVLQYNAEKGVGVLGLSFGILPAVIVGTSLNSSTFISRAVEAYRLSLWIGIRTQIYRRKALSIVPPNHDPSLPWSIVLMGLTRDVIDDLIRVFHKQIGESVLYITGITDASCITVSGRPDYLAAFSASISSSAVIHKTNLDTLYHAPVLAKPVRDRVLSDVATRNIQFPTLSDIRIPIRSTLTGDAITCDTVTPETLVELVVDMITIQPVNWSDVVEKLAETVPVGVPVKLLNCGPGAGLIKSIHRVFSRDNVSMLDLSTIDLRSKEVPKQEPIAIIGMAVNIPGAPDAEKLWEVLTTGVNTISEIPERRFKISDFKSGKNPKRFMKAHTGNFIRNVCEFDNKFFKISPREAKSMDPQQRLLLHAAYEALEDAGYVPHSTTTWNPETFGCYVGVATHDYLRNLRNEIDVYYSTGTLRAFLSGRISYAMKFSGPSMVIDAACSSSAVAFYQGARALTNGDCNAALVGGVNIISSPDMFVGLDRGHFLSPTGQCKAFDASADGYSRSEGVGMFVLKRLSDAVAECDNILGVIRAIEVNQSGLAHSITHPHAPSQAKLLKRVLETGGLDAHHINVVEAHGTGTQAGDPNELESIRSVFSCNRPANNPLHITSIKSNIGHLEAASGAAGLAKLLLMLRHKTIPSVISLKDLNPRIANLASDNTIIDTTQATWNPSEEGRPRVALLNNFGAAGSNTATVIEEYLASPNQLMPQGLHYTFGISAKDPSALEALRARIVDWIQDPKHASQPLSNIAYTTTARRHLYDHRLAVSASTKKELVERLGKAMATQVKDRPFTLAFVFSGQGGQYLGMGYSLYNTTPLFRKIIDECHGNLIAAGFPGVLPILTADGDSNGLTGLEEFEAYQAAMFSLQYALAKLWMSWGVTPSVVVGHSLGEYAALVIAEVLTLKTALMIVANRARYMVLKCAAGSTSMLAVNFLGADIQALVDSSNNFSGITVACYNSSVDVVLAGPIHKLRAFKAHLDAEVHCKSTLLSVPFGYHSSAMGPLLGDLTQFAKLMTINAPSIPIISNVLGDVVLPGDASVFNAEYFAKHCAYPVQFSKGIRRTLTNNMIPAIDAWVEIGPHTTTLPILESTPEIPKSVLLLGSLRKQQEPWSTLTTALSHLFTTNARIKWRNVFAHVPVSCISFVTYPFSKVRFWVPFEEDALASATPQKVAALKPPPELLTVDFRMLTRWSQYPTKGNGFVAIFKTPISDLARFIRGHSVGGMPLCPASVYLEQVFSGLQLAWQHLSVPSSGDHTVLRNVEFVKPLVYDENVTRIVITKVTVQGGAGTFSITSLTDGSAEESTHVRGEYKTETISTSSTKLRRLLPLVNRNISSLVEPKNGKTPQTFSSRTAYEMIFPRVVDYAKEYHTMRSLTVDSTEMEGYASVKLPASHDRSKFVIHPIFTDTLLHVAGFVANLQGGTNDAYICNEVGSVKIIPTQVDNDASYTVYCRNSWLADEGVMLAEAYAVKLSEPPLLVAHLKDMRFRKVRLSSLKRALAHAAKAVPRQQARFAPAALPNLPLCPTTQVQTVPLPVALPVLAQNASYNRFKSEVTRISTGLTNLAGKTSPQTPSTSLAMTAAESQSQVSSPRTLVHEDGLSEPTPFANDSDRDVKGILGAVLDISPKDIGDDTSFEFLGLDSLTSIEAVAALKSESGVDLPGNFFDDYPTARKIQEYLSSRLSQSKSAVNLHKSPPHDMVTYQIAPRQTEEKRKSEFSVTISPASAMRLTKALKLDTTPLPLQKSESKALPLFLIHDGSGLISYYAGVSPLGRQVWGFNNPHFATSEPWSGVVEMASAYAEYISKITRGPIILGGWSFGGVAAYETSLQLAKMGIKIQGVLLIDSPSPINHVPLSDSLIDSVVNLDSRSANSDLGRLVKAQFAMNARMLGEYDPRATGGSCPPLVLLRSSEGFNPPSVPGIPVWLADRSDPKIATAGWEILAPGPVEVLDIPGNHFTPFYPSNIKGISQRMIEGCALLEKA